MRYKKPLIAKMLDAIEAETAISRASDNLAGHLTYIHRLVHELEDRLYRHKREQSRKKNMSAIEYVFSKLAYKSDIEKETEDYG